MGNNNPQNEQGSTDINKNNLNGKMRRWEGIAQLIRGSASRGVIDNVC